MSAKLVIFACIHLKEKEMKRIIFITAVLAVMASASVSCGSFGGKKNANEAELDDSTKTAMEMERMRKEMPEFIIETTHGTMKIRLYDKTPQHRDNFAKLVSENYYDGIRFHRVIEGFMIQTGDPFSRDTALINSWGTGGPDYTVPAEFIAEYGHKKGAIAAARKGDMANPKKASSGSQFYIVHDPNVCRQLDGQYTVFGEVTEGLEVIDAIATVDTDRYDRPYEDVIIISIKKVEYEEPAAPADSTVVEVVEVTDSTETK